jgi:hypothetical protein
MTATSKWSLAGRLTLMVAFGLAVSRAQDTPPDARSALFQPWSSFQKLPESGLAYSCADD